MSEKIKIFRPEIILEGIQIKSLIKAKLLCEALSTIEEECGIHSCRITIKDPFICPEIEIDELCSTAMELLIGVILKECMEKSE